MLKNYFWVFLISMVPLIELRGAIPVGTALFSKYLTIQEGGALPVNYVISIFVVAMVGNMIPVPIIYLFARKFLEWGKDKRFIGGICAFFLEKGAKGGEKLTAKAGRGVFVALLLFVGIPLPGTGAWTGTLAASMLNLKFRETVLAVVLGVLLAGVIMMSLSLGVFSAVKAAV